MYLEAGAGAVESLLFCEEELEEEEPPSVCPSSTMPEPPSVCPSSNTAKPPSVFPSSNTASAFEVVQTLRVV